MNRGLKWLSVATVVAIFLVLMGGTLVTKTGSGEGCGDSWPLCHGRLLPPLRFDSIVEYTHRVASASGGLLVLAMVIGAWRRFAYRLEIRILGAAALFFLVLQSGLGAWAVMTPQHPLVMALHFGVSLMVFVCVLLPYVLMSQLDRGSTHRATPVSPAMRRWTWFSLIFVFAVIYTGAYVTHTRSQLACLDWPLCNGALIPELSGAVGIQFFHRLAAALALLLLGWLVKLASKERDQRPDIYRGALASFATMLVQILTGGIMVLSGLALTWTVLHSATVIIHFGALSYLGLQVLPEPAVRERRAAESTEPSLRPV